MLALVFNRLHDADVFPDVQVSEDVQSIVGKSTAAPDGAVFVCPWRERAEPSPYATGAHRQRVELQFCTALLLRQHGDPRGGERALRFDTLKGQVEGLLAGWQPVAGGDVVSLVGGEVTALGNGVSIYVQTWETSKFLTGA